MCTRLLSILAVFFAATSFICAQQWEWMDVSNSNGGNTVRVEDVTVDEVNDFVYTAGFIEGNSTFSGLPASAGGDDGFVRKYDLNGNLIWSFRIGGTGDDRIHGIEIDPNTNNVLITGFVTGSFASNAVDFQGASLGAPSNASGAIGGEDAFVACYNSLGQLLWHKIVGGASMDRGMDIAVNSSGTFITGVYTNTAGLSAVSPVISSNSIVNNFALALNSSDGSTLWDAVLASNTNDYEIPNNDNFIIRTGITADDNGVYLVTYFSGTAYNVYNSSDVVSATLVDLNPSTRDYVVTSYTNVGDHNWSALYDNIGNVVYGLDITNDCSGVYVSGTLHNMSTTAGGLMINSVHDNFLLSKLDKTTGSEIWMKDFKSTIDHEDHFVGIDVDGYGNLYAVGRLAGTNAFLGTDLSYTSGQSHSEVMIAHFFTDGSFQDFEVLTGTDDSWGMSIATYKNEKYVVGGYFNDDLFFGSLWSGIGSSDGFVASKVLPGPIEYTSPSGGEISGNAAFCTSELTAVPELNVPGGGSFSGPVEVVFNNTTTGEIDLMSSTPGGPYAITYSGSPYVCVPTILEDTIYILQEVDASFTYASTTLCMNGSNVLPTSVTTPGGVFSAQSGLTLANISTGEIDVSTSTAGGPYQLYYTAGGVCPSTDSLAFTVIAPTDPTFAYAQSNYCFGAGTILPSMVASPGGTFSGPAGIVFANTSTGEIDLNASTVGGPYIIQYVTAAPCQVSSTFNLTINPLQDASFSYASATFCSNELNPLPVSIATLGGTFSGPAGLVVNAASGEIDLAASMVGGPYWLVYTTAGPNCGNSDSIQVSIEVLPDPSFAYEYSVFCSNGVNPLPSSITTTGGTFSSPVGLVVNPLTGEIDLAGSTAGGPYAIEYVVSNTFCQDTSTFSVIINQADDASFTYATNHFCTNDANPTPSSVVTSGGTYSGPIELIIDPITGEVDVTTSTLGGPYWLVYTTSGSVCPASDSIQVYVVAAPNASFNYSQSAICQGAGITVSPVVVNSGGTFSAPPEVVIDASTGEIDIDASIAGGPYSIAYTVANAYCQKTNTFDLTILGQDELVSIGYASNDLCISDGNQIPVISGLNGGVFTGPSSIDIVNSITGEISPSTSTLGGPYTIKYVTPGVCPDSLEVLISIFDVATAYAGEDQELFFVFSSVFEADIPASATGQWSTLSTASIADKFDPNSDVFNLELGKNTFVWTVSNGVCPAVSDEVIIEVHDIFIPQALTPNGDDKNDYFHLQSLEDATCSLQVFNRWGQIVYENSDYQNEWNGQNSKGEELKDDTYFYTILINDSLSYNGYVVLKR